MCSGNSGAFLSYKLVTVGLWIELKRTVPQLQKSQKRFLLLISIMYVLLCFNQTLLIQKLFLWGSWTIWWCGECEEWQVVLDVVCLLLLYESLLSEQFAQWLHEVNWSHLITVQLPKWGGCNAGMVSDYFLSRACLSSPSTSRRAQMIKSHAPCPYYLSQASHRGSVWVLQWSWRVKIRPKRKCLLVEVIRRPSVFSFVLNSDCAASNFALSTVMGLSSVMKLSAPCQGNIVNAFF